MMLPNCRLMCVFWACLGWARLRYNVPSVGYAKCISICYVLNSWYIYRDITHHKSKKSCIYIIFWFLFLGTSQHSVWRRALFDDVIFYPLAVFINLRQSWREQNLLKSLLLLPSHLSFSSAPIFFWASLVSQWWKICLHCRNCRRHRFDPWVGRSPGGGHGNWLQYSCLEKPMDRGAWQAIAHRVSKSRKQLSTHTSSFSSYFLLFPFLSCCLSMHLSPLSSSPSSSPTLTSSFPSSLLPRCFWNHHNWFLPKQLNATKRLKYYTWLLTALMNMVGKCPGKRNIIASEVFKVIFSPYLKLNFFAVLSAENILLQTVPKAKAGGDAWGALGYHLVSQPTSRMPVSPALQSRQIAGLMAAVLHQMLQSPLQPGGGLKWRVHDRPVFRGSKMESSWSPCVQRLSMPLTCTEEGILMIGGRLDRMTSEIPSKWKFCD